MAERERRLRSVHVPLTDDEWEELKIEAIRSKRTIGVIVAEALAKNNGSTGQTRDRKPSRAVQAGG